MTEDKPEWVQIGGKEKEYFSYEDGEWYWMLTEIWLDDGTVIKLEE